MSDEKKNINIIGGINRSDGKIVHTSKNSSSTTVLTNWDDMTACKMSKQSVANAYKKHFGTDPDEVHLNDDFCHELGWLSYNAIGTTKYFDVKVVPKSKIAAERSLENHSDTPITHTVTLKTTQGESATVQVDNTSSISMGTNIDIGAPELGLGSTFSQSFSITNEFGSSSTLSTSVEVSDTVEVTVPPHSKRSISLEITWEERQENFEIPVSIQPWGMTGAQFPHRVREHYFWGASHNKYFQPPFSSKLSGSLLASYNSFGKIIVGKVKHQ